MLLHPARSWPHTRNLMPPVADATEEAPTPPRPLPSLESNGPLNRLSAAPSLLGEALSKAVGPNFDGVLYISPGRPQVFE